MAERKLGAKLTAIRGQMARHIDHPFQKTRKQKRTDSSTPAAMNDGKIMINDTDESSFDDLIVDFKKWRAHGRRQYPVTQRLAVTSTAVT